MGIRTDIAWANHTFNIAWGCQKISEGCKHCYADRLASRFGASVWGPNRRRRTFGHAHWREPLAWQKSAATAGVRRKVFCASMTDWCLDDATIDAERPKLWSLIRQTPDLDWLLLTKRADRIADCLPADWDDGWPNVWLGVSIETADYVWRADRLRAIPAVIRFVSYEPALGPLAQALDLTGLHWIIQGGESGMGFRPQNLDWARAMRDACRTAGIPYFYKQAAGPLPERNYVLDGEVIKQSPSPVRERAAAGLLF